MRFLNWSAPALVLALGFATPAFADGRIFVPLPDLSSYQGEDAAKLLDQLVIAVVVGMNCSGDGLAETEWSLLNDSADLLAYGQLGMSVGEYDDEVFKPAFDMLDQADTCENVVPKIDLLIERLIGLGGSLEPFPDQDAAFVEWSARQDAWTQF